MIAYCFPGQGSQKKGMGQELFNKFSDYVDIADRILNYSIEELCVKNPNGKLNITEYTQPALFVVNALSYLEKVNEDGIKPDYLAGHSLGEFNSLLAAGAFDFETGLRIVKKRGELMNKSIEGGMAAVLGLSEKEISEIIYVNKLNNIDIANINTPSQIVLSGPKMDIERSKEKFEKYNKAKYVILNVSGAFHSRYMEEAKNKFKLFLDNITFKSLNIPVISNFTAQPYKDGEIEENLVSQLTHSVKWVQSIRYIMTKGVNNIVQVGPGNVLNGMNKRIIDSVNLQDLSKQMGTKVKSKDNVEEIKNTSFIGSLEFRNKYNLKYSYVAGSMGNGISSDNFVVKMAKANMMSFLGTDGLNLSTIEKYILSIQNQLNNEETYGVNINYGYEDTGIESKIVDLCLKHNVNIIEASGFINLTEDIVRYRLNGLKENNDSSIYIKNSIFIKTSNLELIKLFLSPPPERIISKLLQENKITLSEANLAKFIPMVDNISIEFNSSRHANGTVGALLPVVIKVKDEMKVKYSYKQEIYIGAAGGICIPEAAIAAFVMGADYIVTGCINQCTVEANTSDEVKDLLCSIDVQDIELIPDEKMFDFGFKSQVIKKGVFFPGRLNKLYQLYRKYDSLRDIDENLLRHIQKNYFNKSSICIYREMLKIFSTDEINKAKTDSKYKMALILRWYFNYCKNLALRGLKFDKLNYQVYCSESMGTFNRWVKGTKLKDWRQRHADTIAVKIMNETAKAMEEHFNNNLKAKIN